MNWLLKWSQRQNVFRSMMKRRQCPGKSFFLLFKSVFQFGVQVLIKWKNTPRTFYFKHKKNIGFCLHVTCLWTVFVPTPWNNFLFISIFFWIFKIFEVISTKYPKTDSEPIKPNIFDTFEVNWKQPRGVLLNVFRKFSQVLEELLCEGHF